MVVRPPGIDTCSLAGGRPPKELNLRRVALAAALAFVCAAALLAPSAFAQSTPETWNGLPDRLQIDTGYFRL